MTDFAAVNAVYGTLFTTPNPPARVTVSCGDLLPDGIHIAASFVASRCSPDLRRGLHVQSRSYWAPANIGPYSQAVGVPVCAGGDGERGASAELVYVAGQIPLVPASMDLVSGGFEEQAVLSLQHLWRIGRATGVEWWAYAVILITASSGDEAREKAVMAATIWRLAHEMGLQQGSDDEEDDDDVDIGHQSLYRSWAPTRAGNGDDDATPRPPLPRWDRLRTDYDTRKPPPCVVVEVADLPRGASIEWASNGAVGGRTMIETWGDGKTGGCRVGGFEVSLALVDGRGHRAEFPTDAARELYTSGSWPHGDNLGDGGKIIPCRRVFDADGVQHDGAMIHFRHRQE